MKQEQKEILNLLRGFHKGRFYGSYEECLIADDVEACWNQGEKYNRLDWRAQVNKNFRGLINEGNGYVK